MSKINSRRNVVEGSFQGTYTTKAARLTHARVHGEVYDGVG
jgi:hypothetical protein